MKSTRIFSLLLVALLCLGLFAGCNAKNEPGGTNATALEPEAMWKAVEEQIGLPGEAFPIFVDPADSAAFENFYGIPASDFEAYVWKQPMMMTHSSEILIAKVADGKMDEVKAAIEKRKQDLAAQWSTYLPDQYELVQNAKVVENGKYILFAVSEHADRIETIFNESTK